MANFSDAVILTLNHEGGYVNNPNDSGGATNMGITQRDLPGIPIQNLTVAQAIAYYQEHYWKPLYSQINSQAVANKLFDMGVLLGVGKAVTLLQNALNLCTDGIFGPHTLDAINAADEIQILAEYRWRLCLRFEAIAATHSQDAVFLKGWLNRVNS
jgi:lysozyme family protein